MNLPVFDLHCDTALELLDNQCRPVERLRKRQGHIDLARGGKLAGYAQLFAFFTTPGMDPTGACSPEMIFRAMLKNLQRELEENRDRIVQAGTNPIPWPDLTRPAGASPGRGRNMCAGPRAMAWRWM